MRQSTDFTRKFEIPVPSNFEHRPRCSYIEPVSIYRESLWDVSDRGNSSSSTVCDEKKLKMMMITFPSAESDLNEKELSELSD